MPIKDLETRRAYDRYRSKQKRINHPEETRAYARAAAKRRRKNNPESIRLALIIWRKNNRGKVLAKKLRYRIRHRKELAQKAREYYNKNSERCLIAAKQYAITHPEIKRKARRNWDLKNKAHKLALLAKRKVNLSKVKTDGTAEAFYLFVRSKEEIPCYYCGAVIAGSKAHIDHVIAVSKNGNHASDNLCASCPECNWKKNNKMPSEFSVKNQLFLDL